MPAKATATPRAKPTAVREGERVRAFFAVGKRRMRTDRLEYINAKWFSALPTMRKKSGRLISEYQSVAVFRSAGNESTAHVSEGKCDDPVRSVHLTGTCL